MSTEATTTEPTPGPLPVEFSFTKRPNGGYRAWAQRPNGRGQVVFVVEEVAPWRRTSNYFKWSARSIGSGRPVGGSGSTRIEAVREAYRQLEKKSTTTTKESL